MKWFSKKAKHPFKREMWNNFLNKIQKSMNIFHKTIEWLARNIRNVLLIYNCSVWLSFVMCLLFFRQMPHRMCFNDPNEVLKIDEECQQRNLKWINKTDESKQIKSNQIKLHDLVGEKTKKNLQVSKHYFFRKHLLLSCCADSKSINDTYTVYTRRTV